MTDILDRAVTGSGLVPAFQPVVSLPSESVVGYEALARWPHLDGVTPTQALAHAQRTGKLERLDHECIRRAARGALHEAFVPGMLLFINCEPTTAYVDLSTEASVGEAARSLKLVFELTERGLLTDPRALLRKVGALRSLGYMIALDDVGAHADSLALLDIVAPDIVKLDMGLVQRRPDRAQARTVAAVSAYSERTGATILAEGIETDEHLDRALAYGATLGQGFRFGRPRELATVPGACFRPSWRPRPPAPGRPSPFGLAAPGVPTCTVRKRTLVELSRRIERLAAIAERPAIVLTTVQNHRNFRGSTRARYTAIARKSSLVMVFGENVPAQLGHRIRGVHLDPGDPLSLEWTILVLGPDTAAGLIAREHLAPAVQSNADDHDRRFEMAMTYDRARVTMAARSLLSRCPARRAGVHYANCVRP